jgi:threonine/homoserine/homoserine lactone efflux protein
MLQALFITWLGVCAAQASPGPNMMAVADAALGQGRRSALLTVAGIATGSLVWAGAAALGLGAMFQAFPALLTMLKFAGGAYLLFIGAKALIIAWRGQATTLAATRNSRSDLQSWRRGFVVVMTNPKAALMWSAVATFLFGSGLSGLQVLAFGPAVALSALAIYGGYGVVFSTGLASRAYDRFFRIIQTVFGAAFGALGITLLLSALKELKT